MRYDVFYTDIEGNRDFIEVTQKDIAKKEAKGFKKLGYTRIFIDKYDTDGDLIDYECYHYE